MGRYHDQEVWVGITLGQKKFMDSIVKQAWKDVESELPKGAKFPRFLPTPSGFAMVASRRDIEILEGVLRGVHEVTASLANAIREEL